MVGGSAGDWRAGGRGGREHIARAPLGVFAPGDGYVGEPDQGDYDRAVALFEESLALYRKIGHIKGTSGPLRELGPWLTTGGTTSRRCA